MSRRDIWVYIASPYSKGDQAINVRFQHMVWDYLHSLGVTPIAPLWSHYQQVFAPLRYEQWVEYDNAIIKRCDVCVRLDATGGPSLYVQRESAGADNEAELFLALGKPVFRSLPEFQKWLTEQEEAA